MTKVEAIKLMLDGEKLVTPNGQTFFRFEPVQSLFMYKTNERPSVLCDLNDIDFSDCEVYVELNTLEEAMDHMSRGGVAELAIDTDFASLCKGVRFKRDDDGLYKGNGSTSSLPVHECLFGKVWKVLDIVQE